MTSVTKFGKFLRSVRIARGFTNVNEYLRRYKLPISDVHYRDLETGKKQITMETAHQLCWPLQTDINVFYYYVLQDLLPTNVSKQIVRPIVDSTFENIAEVIASYKSREALYRTVYMNFFSRRQMCMSDEAIEFLKDHIDLVPLVEFIYMVNSTNESEVQALLARNEINMPCKEVLDKLQQLGVIVVTDSGMDAPRQIVRVKPTRGWDELVGGGCELLNNATLRYVEDALNKRVGTPYTDASVQIFAGMYAIPQDAYEVVLQRLADLVASVRGADTDLRAEDSDPYYFLALLSPRPEWAVP